MYCGLDYGEKYIGVAVSESGQLASGIATLNRSDKQWLKELKLILEKYHVKKIVVGLPKKLDGSSGLAVSKVEEFVKMLQKEVLLGVEMWDERLTTGQAERYLRETPVSGSKRRDKVNQLAAQIILQSYLDDQIRKSV